METLFYKLEQTDLLHLFSHQRIAHIGTFSHVKLFSESFGIKIISSLKQFSTNIKLSCVVNLYN